MPFAATYLAAAILHDNHGTDLEARAPVPFGNCSLSIDRYAPTRGPNGVRLPPRLIRYAVVSTALWIQAGSGPDRRDPTSFKVSVRFKEQHGQPFYMREQGFLPAAVTTLELTLAPPVIGCLSLTRLRAGLSAGRLAAIGAPLPDALKVRVVPFEEQLVRRYRQVLAEGLLGAVLVDGDGRSVPIPPAHWREDGASAAFVESCAASMVLDGQEMRGHVCVDLSVLRAGWRAAFAALPSETELAEAELPASALHVGTAPYLDFALHVARTLRITNGRGPDGLTIPAGRLEELIKKAWEAYDKFDEAPSPYKLKILATLLRHPDERGGVKSELSVLARGT